MFDSRRLHYQTFVFFLAFFTTKIVVQLKGHQLWSSSFSEVAVYFRTDRDKMHKQIKIKTSAYSKLLRRTFSASRIVVYFLKPLEIAHFTK